LEYLIGSMVTIIVYAFAHRIARGQLVQDNNRFEIVYSQSHIYHLIKPFLEYAPIELPATPRQTENYVRNAYLKVMVVNSKAYWIKDNALYVADVSEGEVKKETTKEVDTMSMSKVELNEMLFIVEKLREENDDYRNSGK